MNCASNKIEKAEKGSLPLAGVTVGETTDNMDAESVLDSDHGGETQEEGKEEEERKIEISVENSPFTKHVDFVAAQNDLSSWQNWDSEALEVSEGLVVSHLKIGDKKQLKSVIRSAHSWSPSHDIRHLLWKQICSYLHKSDSGDLFEELAADMIGEGQTEIRLPSFLSESYVEHYKLTTDGDFCVRKIVAVMEVTNPDITYCPILFSLVAVMLHYMSPSDCFNCVYGLLRNTAALYIHQTKVSYQASRMVMRDLAKKYAKSSYSHLVRTVNNIDTVFEEWIWWILRDLPFHYLVRVLDCYLVEGVKIFYRVALAILILYHKNSGRRAAQQKRAEAGDTNSPNGARSIQQFCREAPFKLDRLLKVGFSVALGMRGLSRKEILKLQTKHEMYINSQHHVNDIHGSRGDLPISKSFSGPMILQNIPSTHLTVDMLYTIWTWLPTRYAVCQPELLYTSEEHGTSLLTLYKRVERHQPTLIVIKDTNDEMFGAFCSMSWGERIHSNKNLSYFGTGETFIFTLVPEKKKYDWVGLTRQDIPNTANMFQAGDRTMLTIGGGHGEAIILDENLLHCRTENCDTFDNEPLCSNQDFQCKVVEVYGFQSL